MDKKKITNFKTLCQILPNTPLEPPDAILETLAELLDQYILLQPNGLYVPKAKHCVRCQICKSIDQFYARRDKPQRPTSKVQRSTCKECDIERTKKNAEVANAKINQDKNQE